MPKKTVAIIENQDAETLRQLAASLDMYIRRGPGAMREGNIHTLITTLARAYRRDPARVLSLLESLRDTDNADDKPPIAA